MAKSNNDYFPTKQYIPFIFFSPVIGLEYDTMQGKY